jgi:hypothetical protein
LKILQTNFIKDSIVFALGAFFVFSPIYSLFIKGTFNWHIQQPEGYQGFLEIICLTAFLAMCQSLRNLKINHILIVLGLFTYCRRHAIDIPILLSWIYIEGIIALGYVCLKNLRLEKQTKPFTMVVSGITGIIVYSLFIWMFSGYGFGSKSIIQLMTILIFGISLIISKNARLFEICFSSLTRNKTLEEKILTSFIASFFCGLFAKASVVVDHDSIWYGLRANEVLIGDGSLFKWQGLVSVAHYVPKLFEALQLPFSNSKSISIIFSLSIWSWFLFILCTCLILRECRVEKKLRVTCAAVMMTIPAGVYIAVTAKGDCFSALLIGCSLFGFVRFYKTNEALWLYFTLSSILLSIIARLSNLPYSTFLLCVVLFLYLFQKNKIKNPMNKMILILVFAFLVFVLVNMRTFMLSGLPFVAPNILVEIFEAFGFKKNSFVGSLPASAQLKSFPIFTGSWNVLFNPNKFGHLKFSWVSNYWVFLFIFYLFYSPIKKDECKIKNILFCILFLGICSFYFYKSSIIGHDGNYFIIPIAAATILATIKIDSLSKINQNLCRKISILFLCSNSIIGFVTGSWGPGTRPFDFNFARLPDEKERRAIATLEFGKLKNVSHFFSTKPSGTRVVGVTGNGGDNGVSPCAWWLPVRYEELNFLEWANPGSVSTSDRIITLLRSTQVNYVIVNTIQPFIPLEIKLNQAISDLSQINEAVLVFSDGVFSVWKIHEK